MVPFAVWIVAWTAIDLFIVGGPSSPILAMLIFQTYLIAGMLAAFCTPVLFFRLLVRWVEKPGAYGLADRTFRNYREGASGDKDRWPVNWSLWIDDHHRWLACATLVYGILLPLISINIDWYPGSSDFTLWRKAALLLFWGISIAAKIVCLLCLMLLLSAIARRVHDRLNRWRTIAVAWATAGLALMGTSAIFGKSIQSAINNEATRRMDPDNFRDMIDAHFLDEGADPLAILDHPAALDNYTWSNMLAAEAIAICIIALIAALVLRAAAKRSWRYSGVLVVAAIALPTVVYAFALVGWSAIFDYDIFIGDNILGALSIEYAFVIFPFDEVAAFVLSCYAALMSWQISSMDAERL